MTICWCPVMSVAEERRERRQHWALSMANTRANDVDCQHRCQHDDVAAIAERQRCYSAVREIPN